MDEPDQLDEPHRLEPLRGCLVALISLGGSGILFWVGAYMLGWVHL